MGKYKTGDVKNFEFETFPKGYSEAKEKIDKRYSHLKGISDTIFFSGAVGGLAYAGAQYLFNKDVPSMKIGVVEGLAGMSVTGFLGVKSHNLLNKFNEKAIDKLDKKYSLK